jgi:hypothetical protein
MLHPTPFTAVKQIHVMQPLMQRITERTVEIAVEKKSLGDWVCVHGTTVPKRLDGIHRY